MKPNTPLPNLAIVNWGRTNIGAYPHEEFLDSLRRSFVENKADYIVLDDYTTYQRFIAASVAWAIDAGLLVHDLTNDDDIQNVVHHFRPTPEGWTKFRETVL